MDTITELPPRSQTLIKESDPRVKEIESSIYEELMNALADKIDKNTAIKLLPVVHRMAFREATLEKRADEADKRAVLDPFLTDFFGHRYFNYLLAKEVKAASQNKPDSAVISLDFDNFGIFNKTFKQVTGDGLLKEGAKAMLGVLRRGDDVGRTGGDELSAIIRRTGIEGAVAAAKRMQAAIIDASQKQFGHTGWVQTISVGISLIDSPAAKGNADEALLAAKEAGKNSIFIAQSNIETGQIRTIKV